MIGNSNRSDTQGLVEKEISLFEEEHEKFFVAGETKPKDIGRPFLLHRPEDHSSVLLIHGFMAAPYEVREWAEHLFSHGHSVFAPRLPGHGTSADDLEKRSFPEWVNAVERGYSILQTLGKPVIVAGFSTGAGIALHQAICHPHQYKAVISISAPMKFKSLSSYLTGVLEKWNRLCHLKELGRFQKKFAVNHPDNPEINYRRCPIHGFNQVKHLMRNVHRRLPEISIPALVVQGNRDPKVSPKAGRMIFERLGSVDKRYVEIDHHEHGIVRGRHGQLVFSAVQDFLSRYTGS